VLVCVNDDAVFGQLLLDQDHLLCALWMRKGGVGGGGWSVGRETENRADMCVNVDAVLAQLLLDQDHLLCALC
jgi:hypothetical protein